MTHTTPISPDPAPLARRILRDDLPGWWAKTMLVPPGHVGLDVVAGVPGPSLPPGKHRVRGDAVLVRAGPLACHPFVGDVLTGDDQLAEADFLLSLEVAEPALLLSALLGGRWRLTLADLEERVAAQAVSPLQDAARQYALDDLCGDEPVRDQIAGQVRSYLTTALQPWGLRVTGVRHLAFRRQADAVVRAQKARELEEALRDEANLRKMGELEDQAQLQDFVRNLAADFNAPDLLDDGDVAQALEVIQAQPPAEAPGRGQALAAALGRQLRRIESRLNARFTQFMRSLGESEVEEIVPLEETKRYRRWYWLVTFLRFFSAFLSLVVATIIFFMPRYFEDPRVPQFLVTILGFLVAALALASSFWINRRVRVWRMRDIALADARLATVSPQRRREADRLVREQLGRELAKVFDNLHDLRQRVYRAGQSDLALALRDVEQETEKVQKEVAHAEHYDSAYFRREQPSDQNLQDMLNFDLALLREGEQLAARSRDLSRTDGSDEAGIRSLAEALRHDLRDLRHRFTDRAQYLQNVT